MAFQGCIIRPGALGGFRIRAILSRNLIISITRPPRQLRTWEYYRQNRTIKLDFMRRQRQVLECFWKSDQKSTLIAGFRTCNERGTSRGSKPVRIGDLHMGLISHLHRCPVIEDWCCAESHFQVLEGSGLWFPKMPGSILLAEISEVLGEFHVTTDEALIEVGES